MIVWLDRLSMYELIQAIREFQEAPTDENFVRIIGELEGRKIRETMRVPASFREDYAQEWLIRLFLLVRKFRYLPCPVKVGDSDDVARCAFSSIASDPLFAKWIREEGSQMREKAGSEERNPSVLIERFTLYANQVRFLHLLKRTSDFLYADFWRKAKKQRETPSIVSRFWTEKPKSVCDFSFLEEKDREFLLLFIGEGDLLSEREVAKKLDVSQQAVHRRKARIVRKMRSSKEA